MADEQTSTTGLEDQPSDASTQISQVIAQVQSLILDLTKAYQDGHIGEGVNQIKVKVKSAKESDLLLGVKYDKDGKIVATAQHDAITINDAIAKAIDDHDKKLKDDHILKIESNLSGTMESLTALLGDDKEGVDTVINTFAEVKKALADHTGNSFNVFALINQLNTDFTNFLEKTFKEYKESTESDIGAAITTANGYTDRELVDLTTDLKKDYFTPMGGRLNTLEADRNTQKDQIKTLQDAIGSADTAKIALKGFKTFTINSIFSSKLN
jgi:molybdopterin converting factor small subunit